MTEKNLLSPWDSNGGGIDFFEIILTHFGYKVVLLNAPVEQTEFRDIEQACIIHQPKIIITNIHDWDVSMHAGFGNKFCRMIRESSHTRNIGLVSFHGNCERHIRLLPDRHYCAADELIEIQAPIELYDHLTTRLPIEKLIKLETLFPFEELGMKLQRVIDKYST